jgi:amidase
MSQRDLPSEAKWQSVSRRKKAEQTDRIPKEWRLSGLPGAGVKSYTDIPRNSGLLSKEELDITEKYDAVALAEAIRETTLKCIDVARAFCKVSLLKPDHAS